MALIARAPSVNLNANPGQFISNLVRIASDVNKGAQNRQEAENLKIFRDGQLAHQDRVQDFAEGADARELAKAEAERERKRQAEIDKAQAVTGVLEDDSNQFALPPGSLEAMTSHPGFKKILEGTTEFQNTRPDGTGAKLFTPERREALAKQGNLITNFINKSRDNPSLHMDPDKISREIRAAGRARGDSPEVINQMVKQGLESFKTLSPENVALQNANINADAKNQTTLVAAAVKAAGRADGNSVGSAAGLGRGTFKGDANARANQEYLDSVLERSSAKDAANWLEKIGDWVNPLNFTDATREDLTPILVKFEELGIRPLTAIQILEAEELLLDGEWTNTLGFGDQDPVQMILGNVSKMEERVAKGHRIQGSNASDLTGGAGAQSGASLGLSLAQNLQGNTDARRTQLFGNSAPRKQTLAERRQRASDFISEQTGVKLDLAPSDKSRAKTKKDLFDVDDVDDTEKDTVANFRAKKSNDDTKLFRNNLPPSVSELPRGDDPVIKQPGLLERTAASIPNAFNNTLEKGFELTAQPLVQGILNSTIGETDLKPTLAGGDFDANIRRNASRAKKKRNNVVTDFSGTGINRVRFEQGLSPQQLKAYRKAQDPNTSQAEAIRIMKQLRKSSP